MRSVLFYIRHPLSPLVHPPYLTRVFFKNQIRSFHLPVSTPSAASYSLKVKAKRPSRCLKLTPSPSCALAIFWLLFSSFLTLASSKRLPEALLSPLTQLLDLNSNKA